MNAIREKIVTFCFVLGLPLWALVLHAQKGYIEQDAGFLAKALRFKFDFHHDVLEPLAAMTPILLVLTGSVLSTQILFQTFRSKGFRSLFRIKVLLFWLGPAILAWIGAVFSALLLFGR